MDRMTKHNKDIEISDDLSNFLFNEKLNLNLIAPQKLKELNAEISILIIGLRLNWEKLQNLINKESIAKEIIKMHIID